MDNRYFHIVQRGKFLFSIILFMWFCYMPSSLFAETLDKHSQLNNIKSDIKKEIIKFEEANAKEQKISSKLRLNQDEYYALQEEANRTKKQLKATQQRLRHLKFELKLKEQSYSSNQKDLETRLARIYEHTDPSFIFLFTKTSNFSEFLKMFYYLQLIVDNDFKLLKKMKNEKIEITKKKEEVEKSYNKIIKAKEELSYRKRRMSKIVEEQKYLLSIIKKEQKEYSANINSLKSSKENIEEEIRIHEEQSRLTVSYSNNIAAFSNQKDSSYSIVMEATAYDPSPLSCGPYATGYTAIGLPAGYGVVAVDPSVIPLGTQLYIEGYGYAVAADTGSAICGNRIDLCFNTYGEAMAFGRRTVKVYILK